MNDTKTQTARYIQWTADENTQLGHDAAMHMYRGVTELNAFRMAQTRLKPERQRELATVSNVPKTARNICATELKRLLREAKRIQPEVEEDVGLKLTYEQRIQALEQQLQALSVQTTQHVAALTRRISELEDLVLDSLADAEATRDAIKKNKNTTAGAAVVVPRIAVLGIKPEQNTILKRDFPGVNFTFVDDGKSKLGSGLSNCHLVLVTRWNSTSLWDQVKSMPNARFVSGGMSMIKEYISETIKQVK